MLLNQGMEIIRIKVRFEVPAGVKIDSGVVLGSCTQLCPGLVLDNDTEVVEWPYDVTLSPGTELVKHKNFTDHIDLHQTVTVNSIPLPKDCVVIKLPTSIFIPSAQVLAEAVTIGIEEEISNKAVSLLGDSTVTKLPLGMLFLKRDSKKCQLPPQLLLVPKSYLSNELLVFLNFLRKGKPIKNIDFQHNLKSYDLENDINTTTITELLNESDIQNVSINSDKNAFESSVITEVVQIMPAYFLPHGTELIEGVTIIEKPCKFSINFV